MVRPVGRSKPVSVMLVVAGVWRERCQRREGRVWRACGAHVRVARPRGAVRTRGQRDQGSQGRAAAYHYYLAEDACGRNKHSTIRYVNISIYYHPIKNIYK